MFVGLHNEPREMLNYKRGDLRRDNRVGTFMGSKVQTNSSSVGL
ncbi:hypothetical protein LINPERPRIM_LOCUS18425 [Linum perenne]